MSSPGEVPRHPEEMIDNAELERGTLLGAGAFGTVHLARWRGTPMALKTAREHTPI
jgi:predicted Ser/Thr protein kinase